MNARPAWDPSHPDYALYRGLIQKGFELMYPGPTRFDAIGKRIDVPPRPPHRIAHLVAQVNREMEQRERNLNSEAAGDGAVHVQSHSREDGKVEVADYWRAAPGEGGASESGRDSGGDTDIDEDQSPQTAESGDDELPEMINPSSGGRIRGDDGPPYGSGDFGSSRGRRRHEGVDVEAEPGTSVVSPVSGRVEIGDPYGDDPNKRGIYQSVRIKTDDGSVVKVFYVKPGAGIQNGEVVKAGQPIGTAQDLSRIYPPKDGGRMTNHVHVEVWKNGRRRNPTGVLFPNKQ